MRDECIPHTQGSTSHTVSREELEDPWIESRVTLLNSHCFVHSKKKHYRNAEFKELSFSHHLLLTRAFSKSKGLQRIMCDPLYICVFKAHTFVLLL